MPDEWFNPIAEDIHRRLNKNTNTLEFIAGIRVNGVPHIGTYMTLASTFVFAEQASRRFKLPASVHIHFLDNDPAIETAKQNHFHCVFQKRSDAESSEFINLHYVPFLNHLAVLSSCSYTSEIYSASQFNPVFRSTVLKALRQWKDFKYYVSGPALTGSPTGVRGIGSPCPKCGLFEGWIRPEIELDHHSAILESTCCDHGRYSSLLAPSNDTFINLETTFRNVIKEIMTLNKPEVLSVIIKGQDWQEGLRNVNSVLEILGIEKEKQPLRFLLPVVKTATGVKFSKSAIQRFSSDFADVNPALLNMILFREQQTDYPSVLFNVSKQILNEPEFENRPVQPLDISRHLRG